MADACKYAVLVELEESNVPRLKNKLWKYFQSKKSNGGDCEVDYENGSSTAVVRFRREEGKCGPVNYTVYAILTLKVTLIPFFINRLLLLRVFFPSHRPAACFGEREA